MGSAGSIGAGVDQQEDKSWIADAVNQALLHDASISQYFDQHCSKFLTTNDAEEYRLQHHNVFQSYQSLVDESIKGVLTTYGLDMSELLRSLEQRATATKSESLAALIRRLSTYENFPAFAAQMRSHGKSMELIKNNNHNHNHNRRSDNETNDHNNDATMKYLTRNLALDGGGGGGGGGGSGGGGGGSGGGPTKISKPIVAQPKDADDELFKLLSQQERLVEEMKLRQRKCVHLARPMGVDKARLKALFEYVRDTVVSQDGDAQQHLAVIRDILETSNVSIENDNTKELALEMTQLAKVQRTEEDVQRSIDQLLPNDKNATTTNDNDDELARVLKASRQLHEAKSNSNEHDNDELARVIEASRRMYEEKSNDLARSSGSPTTTLMKKAAITSAAEEADRRARMDANEKNYNKTLEEVILRSKIEAETEEAERLRKLMVETAMAAQLSEKDHVNSTLQAQLMALEARLAGLQASSSAKSKIKEETEESLRAELQMKEQARKEIQEEMKKIFDESERRANTLLESKNQEVAEVTKEATEKEKALRLENSIFKKALEREAKDAEDAKKALLEHQRVATQLQESMAAAQREFGASSESKGMEMERLNTLLDEERRRIHSLEADMKQRAKEIEHRAKLSLEKVEQERIHQIALHQQQMDELMELRTADAARVAEHQDRADKLQKELDAEALERLRLEQDVQETQKEQKRAEFNESKAALESKQVEAGNKAALASLQEQMAIKEQQLELQLREIELAKDHEAKAHELQTKLRAEQQHKQELEARLREAEESKRSSTRDSETKLQELTSAVDEARLSAQNIQSEASQELEMMRSQLDEERRKHQQQLRETVERELLAARDDAESKVSGLATEARTKENELVAELERMRTKERAEKDARILAEDERSKLYAKLREQNESSARERMAVEQEKERFAKERDEHSDRMNSQLKEMEQKAANDAEELQRRSKEVCDVVCVFFFFYFYF